MIRLCHAITRLIRGGAAKVLMELVRRLPRDRYEQSVICGASADEALVREAADAGAQVVVNDHLVREIRLRKDMGAALSLMAQLRKLRPDILHLHTYKAGVVGSLVSRLAGLRAVVFSPHGHIFAAQANISGVPPAGAKLKLLKRLTQFAQKFPVKIVALSNADRDQQIELKLGRPEQYVVIPNGLDLEEFGQRGLRPREAARAGLRVNGRVIGTVGRLAREKGHEVLLRALAKLPDDVQLVIVGEGEQYAALERQAAERGLAERVRFTGYVDSRLVLRAFDIYVQPSYYEGFGLSILEAMAAGLPVVACRVGGVADVVVDGETGLLVPAGDPEALATAVRRMLQDSELARRCGEAAAQRVRDLFSVEKMISAYDALYRETLRSEHHASK